MHRLILIEGLPCSGKSTAAKYLADRFHMKNVDEGTGNHPADYENHAFLTMDTLKEFSREDCREILSNAEPVLDGAVVPLAGFQNDPLLKALLPYKIYDGLPWESERPVMLHKWRQFAENIQPDEAYVFNCVFLQNPMCETMIRFGMKQEESAAYIREICEIIQPLDPLVIYLRRDDIEPMIMHAYPERGDNWMQQVIRYHCAGKYGKAHGLSGFSGYLEALRERQKRELSILEQLPVKHIVLHHPQKNWEKAYTEILQHKEYPL